MIVRRGVWLSLFALWAAVAICVVLVPPALSSDDALFFMRGLTRFSILDFSPQFPGYPGFILMGRAALAVTGDALTALGLLCAIVTLLMPWIAAYIGNRNAGAALAAFALVFLQPLGPILAFNLLSDGAGLLFILVFLAVLPSDTHKPVGFWRAVLAGAALGWALACRPSYLVLALACGAGATFAAPRGLWPLWLGMGLVLGPIALGLLAIEPLYLVEGARFIQGHAQIWGNTALTNTDHPTWLATLLQQPLLAIVLAVETLAVLSLAMRRVTRVRPGVMALVTGFLGYAIWTLWFQNPNSLRHLAPLFVLGAIGLAIRTDQRVLLAGVALISAVCLGRETNLIRVARPPLLAAAHHLTRQEDAANLTLVTNHGVQLMRASLPLRPVYDAYYAGDAALGANLAQGPVWRLSSTRPDHPVQTIVFPGRFLGEPSLFMYGL